jgi:hypothetical protein
VEEVALLRGHVLGGHHVLLPFVGLHRRDGSTPGRERKPATMAEVSPRFLVREGHRHRSAGFFSARGLAKPGPRQRPGSATVGPDEGNCHHCVPSELPMAAVSTVFPQLP